MKNAVTETMNRLCTDLFRSTHTAFLILDTTGNIVQSGGALQNLSILPSLEASPVHEILPFMKDILPIKGRSLNFLNVHLPGKPAMDAQVFRASDGYGIILAVAEPDKNGSMPFQNRHYAFLEELFHTLDIAVLEMDSQGRFVLIGIPPTWIEQLPEAPRTATGFAHENNVFNFLEHFIRKARHRWQQKLHSPVKSALWTLKNKDVPEMRFEAIAVEIHGKKLLIISQRIYQKRI